MTQRHIEIEGARTHNLKNVSADIPQGKITVITGPSGCGKSSLAFDTLYAEGQRRFVESMSTYARQFIEKMQRPDVDQIRHLQPAIAIEQKNSVKNARSTIGTSTEISDYLRLLFARAGTTICPDCRVVVREDSPQSVFDELYSRYADKRVLLLAPLTRSLEVGAEALRTELIRAGFLRVLRNVSETVAKPKTKRAAAKENDRAIDMPVDNARPWIDLEEPDDARALAETLDQPIIHVVVDRVALSEIDRDRVTAAIATAFQAGHGTVAVMPIDAPDVTLQRFHSGYQCNHCGKNFPRPEPNLFSFNSPLGACTLCNGFGKVTDIDWDRVFQDKALCLNQEPIAPFNSPSYCGNYKYITSMCKTARIPFDVPINELDDKQMEILRYGPDGLGGIREFFTKLENEKYKIQSRITVARYRGYTTCPECKGSRLLQAGRSVYWGPEKQWVKSLRQLDKPFPAEGTRWPMHIGEMSRMSIGRLYEALESIELNATELQLVGRIYTEVVARLSYLNRVGLGYLTLDRQTRTLSGGEAQRINLATALGTALTQTLYVLDEPTVGLHPRDSRKLLGILRDLRDKGNTLVVVEHDTEMILGADQLIDIGPAAGSGGGQILFSGTPDQLTKMKSPTLTAQYLGRPGLASATKKTKPAKKVSAQPILEAPEPRIVIVGARENNLRNVTAQIPLHQWVCVTGVSGSGKSTLIHSILFEQFNSTMHRCKTEPGQHDRIDGLSQLKEIYLVDQSPIGMSARSNPVTYVKAYDAIRKLLASSREARTLGLSDSSFSFNAGTGRCEACEGTGVTTYDMHFLAEITLPCEACNGKRFGPRVLSVTFNGKSVDQILGLTVDDAAEFFKAYPAVTKKLQPLKDVGLGYLTLGQSTATLSGGEAQRLKLASHLSVASPSYARTTMMIFDEPTTGLHLSDLATLSKVFLKLVEAGYSLVIIEHNLDIIRQADWIIDIGPEAGDGGGQIVAAGPPAHVANVEASHTGQFLKEIFTGQK